MTENPKDKNGPRPRYTWRPNNDGVTQHFTALDGNAAIGMIHSHHTHPWLWYMTYGSLDLDRRGFFLNGFADSPRAAAKFVEDTYDAVVAACGISASDDRVR